ncbi:hypothetical protein ACFUCV_14880 [Specibacter sp. NPDC057265]|uniref:hypothetical protein n=1 Tax=Specibacter sp. NPDC057265 TaxID=3346075 RepID=UPI00364404A6
MIHQENSIERLNRRHPVLISIRTQFVRKIMDGSKTFELRKKIFPTPVGRSVIFYSSGEDKAITARGVVASVVEGTPAAIWIRLSGQLGISRADFTEYFKGSDVAYAIELEHVLALENPISLNEMRQDHGLEPPQSWRYLDRDSHAKLLERL